MKKSPIVIFLIFLVTSTAIFGQDKNANLGIKGGVNYGKFTPNQSSIDYKYQTGFYIGGFYKIQMKGKWQFQPELLFALQGSKVNTKDNVVTDFDGKPMPYTDTFEFEYEMYELTISIPLLVKLYVSNKFYIESGPQLGFIIDREITSSQFLLDGTDSSFVKQDGDNFDFGVSLGTGYDISKHISINLRAFNGLIKKYNDSKSFVLNIGMEYNL